MASLTVDSAAVLFKQAAACERCPRMAGRRRVLSQLNGTPDATVLLIGEAPGRRGAERHGIPFHGDAAGRNFERLLASCGLERDDVFITNAVLCNPQTPDGHNSKPLTAELANCEDWLRATLELVDPELVVALGAVALGALGRIEGHNLQVSRDAGRVVSWSSRKLGILFHPGGRTLARRPLETQIADWRQVLSGREPGPTVRPGQASGE